MFLVLVFTFRFFVEFFKENQSSFEAGMTLNMGQILSIPFVLIGFVFILRSMKTKESNIKYIELPSFEEVSNNKNSFINMYKLFYKYNRLYSKKGLIQKHKNFDNGICRYKP